MDRQEKYCPLYRKLAEKLAQKISGLPAGSRLLSAKQLAEQENVSYETAFKALDLLKRRGLIERRRGSGTFCAQHKDDQSRNIYFSLPGAGVFSSSIVTPLQNIYRGAQTAAIQHGISMQNFIGIQSNFNYDINREAITALPPQSKIIVDTYLHTMFPLLAQHDMQVLLLDDFTEERNVYNQYTEKFHRMCFDRIKLLKIAMKALHDAGRSNILFLTDTSPYFSPWRVGYRQALADLNIPYRPELEMTIPPQYTMAYREVRSMLYLRKEYFFDAVLCVVYTQAIGAYQAIRASGLQVPRDIAILSLSDNDALEDNPLPIDSISFDYPESGFRALCNVADFAASPVEEHALIKVCKRNSLI